MFLRNISFYFMVAAFTYFSLLPEVDNIWRSPLLTSVFLKGIPDITARKDSTEEGRLSLRLHCFEELQFLESLASCGRLSYVNLLQTLLLSVRYW